MSDTEVEGTVEIKVTDSEEVSGVRQHIRRCDGNGMDVTIVSEEEYDSGTVFTVEAVGEMSEIILFEEGLAEYPSAEIIHSV